jgi:hypothetical protein
VFPGARRRCSGEECQRERGRDIDGCGGWCFQVQRAKRCAPIKKLGEATRVAQREGDFAAAFCKEDRGDWTVTMRAGLFLAMLPAFLKDLAPTCDIGWGAAYYN